MTDSAINIKICNITNAERKFYRYLRTIGVSRHEANLILFGYTEAWHAFTTETETTIASLKQQIQELLPYAINDAEQGIALGPAPEGHEDDCPDCIWYRQSVELLDRINSGEFNR